MAIALDDLARFLDRLLAVERFGDDQGGIFRASNRPVRRLGLTLEPWPGLATWVERERLDALFLHRPWRLPPDGPGDLGVLAYHLAFDERLTTGYNPRLAEVLGMTELEVLGRKEGRPLGMLGAVPDQEFARFARVVTEVFGGNDAVHAGDQREIGRVAVVGAMTEALVREAAARGVQVYVTGQWRQPATRAVEGIGIGVVAVGHRRAEEWGLRALAAILEERWAGLVCRTPRLSRGVGDDLE